MTLRHLYSSILFLGFISCSPVSTKLLYEGVNEKGKHSRALYHHDNGFVVGGKDGVFSQYDQEFNQESDRIMSASDLRDVHVFSDGTMIFINSGDQGRIYRVSPNREKIEVAYDRDGVFLDGIDFWDDLNGIAYGDPVNGKLVILLTRDGGKLWAPANYDDIPYALPNEAGFAASGTGISVQGRETVYIGTGMGDTARVFCSYDKGEKWSVKTTPIKAGDSYGIYSMFYWSEDKGVIVGGSYLEPDDKDSICFVTNDGGNTWADGSNGLGGYTSCVHGLADGSFLVATGRVGTYYSLDFGLSWQLLFDETYYSVRVSEDFLYFSGKEGKVSVYQYTVR